MTSLGPAAQRYLSTFRSSLDGLSLSDQQEAVDEIGRHMTDAVGAGQRLDRVLESLGPPDLLARAYGQPANRVLPPSRRSVWVPTLAVAGLFAVGGLPTFVVTIVLGTVGATFVLTGLALLMAGLATLSGLIPPGTGIQDSPLGAVIVGPVFMIVGALSIALLGWLLWVATRTVRRLLTLRA
jgi:uncharacterized membrane protein